MRKAGFIDEPLKKIHAIDRGTHYDVIGNLRRLATEIEDGQYGHVSDVVIGIRRREPVSGRLRYTGVTYGLGSDGNHLDTARALVLALTPVVHDGRFV